MKSTAKRVAVLGLIAAFALSLVTGLYLLQRKSAVAESDGTTIATAYFYDHLVDENGSEWTLARKFYNALDEMNKSGDFKDGQIDYSLTDHDLATSAEIQAWVMNGDLAIPKAFSAARDAYLTDHPEVFYIDFYKMTISAARTGNNYTAFIDSGREANIYYDDGFQSEDAVNSAIALFEAKVDEIAAKAIEVSLQNDYNADVKVSQVGYVNEYFTNKDNLQYDYGSYEEFVETGSTSSAASINTAYGALVVKKAVCGGYARAFKAVMDKLEIPCLVVSGYGLSKDENGKVTERSIGHAWNYVWYKNLPEDEETEGEEKLAKVASLSNGEEGQWYAVDTTWNSSARNKSKYMNMGGLSLISDHIIDGVVSSSNYELKYPELSPYNYGCKTNSNGLSYGVTYQPYGDVDEHGQPMMMPVETVSYNGKSAKIIFDEDGLHLAVRHANIDKDKVTGEVRVHWTVWTDLSTMVNQKIYEGYIIDDGYGTTMPGNASYLYTQYAVMEVAPDLDVNPDSEYEISVGFNLFYLEDETHDPGEYMSAVSEVLTNKSYGTYAAAPFISKSNPSHQVQIEISDNMRDSKITDKVMMREDCAMYYEITYDEDLHVIDDTQPIGISWISQHSNASQYAKLLPLEDGSMVQLKEDKRTLRFRFMPSLMYEHNGELYNFTFTNVGSCQARYDAEGKEYITNKIPNPVAYSYARSYILCPARLGGGRLWIECCAQPTLLSNSDLSEVEFKDENGNIYSEQQRSQMMLVVDTVKPVVEQEMLDHIDGNSDIDIKKDDIEKSETYDIELQICGKYSKIANGSYVKIALGFPEGYGPEDEGVTFRLYHYKHDDEGNYIGVEEIPCVVTQFGIVATVSSFSPYMVAVVPKDKAPSYKTVFASVDGKGGSLNKEDGKIRKLTEGESYTYTISPNSGYSVYKVTLNDKDVTSQIVNNQLTVRYEDLASSNEVEIQYIADAAAQRFEEKAVVEPVKVYVEGERRLPIPESVIKPETPRPEPTPDPVPDVTPGGQPSVDGSTNGNNTWELIGIIVGCIAIVALGTAIAVVIVRYKKQSK